MAAGTTAGARRRSTRGASALPCLWALLLSCSDPRPRPAPPAVDLSFAATLVVKSPGSIAGSLFVSDGDGINTIQAAIRSSDSTFVVNAPITPADLFQATQPIRYNVPPGMPIGTRIRLVVTVTDFVGFTSSDSAFFTVQDTVSAAR
jgi:hypothetical protein